MRVSKKNEGSERFNACFSLKNKNKRVENSKRGLVQTPKIASSPFSFPSFLPFLLPFNPNPNPTPNPPNFRFRGMDLNSRTQGTFFISSRKRKRPSSKEHEHEQEQEDERERTKLKKESYERSWGVVERRIEVSSLFFSSLLLHPLARLRAKTKRSEKSEEEDEGNNE